ncbi:MAG: hypothetical protein ABI867_17595, partial [Kofleriaceae bacterium]
MKLRNRLLLFSTTQLAVFGALFALAYGVFAHSILPMFEDLVHEKTTQVTRMVSAELDVALGADDRKLMAAIADRLERDPDFAYVVVRGADDKVVLARGSARSSDPFRGPPMRVTAGDGVIES